MAKIGTPLSVKVFKTKKYFLDKKSDTKYFFTRLIKHNFVVKTFVFLSKAIKTFFRNLKENAENWKYRASADENFKIDT